MEGSPVLGVPVGDHPGFLDVCGHLLAPPRDPDTANFINRVQAIVYDRWSFQINVTALTFNPNADSLRRISVTSDDVRASRSRKPWGRLSVCAVEDPGARLSLGPGRVEKRGDGFATFYDFEWVENPYDSNVYSVVVGDLAATVLKWRLTDPENPLQYEQITLEQPDDEAVRYSNCLDAWRREGLLNLPEDVVEHARSVLAALSRVPAFVDVLDAVFRLQCGSSGRRLGAVPPSTEPDRGS